jgi:hypothetical protein
MSCSCCIAPILRVDEYLPACILLIYYLLTLKVEKKVSLKRRLILIGLHVVILQKIEVFITTAVRNLNPHSLMELSLS